MKSFETGRLIVRGFKPEDWRDLQEYVSQKEVTQYDHDYPGTDEDCKGIVEYFSKGDGFWAVCLKDTEKMIGHVVCHQKEPPEFLTWHIGFVFNPTFYGQGYATESCQRILHYVFEELGAHRIESACHPDNRPAWKLLERLSMRREAHHRKSGFIKKTSDGEPIWWDSYVYAILEEEWIGRK
jgi:ribosomal-protein-alanine N-acetyltransferase